MPVTKQPPKIYQLKISLDRIRPQIWRRFQVRSDINLLQLHKALQSVMGWKDYHLYCFEVFWVRYGDPFLVDPDLEMLDASGFTVEDFFPRIRSKCHYNYDFGDNWQHTIVLEKRLDPEPGERYPLCVDGERSCPPEDCGGVGGYKELLRVLGNPNHRDYKFMRRWAGRWNPERFDRDQVNKRISRRVVCREPANQATRLDPDPPTL